MNNILTQSKQYFCRSMIPFVFLAFYLGFIPSATAKISEVTVVNNCDYGQTFVFSLIHGSFLHHSTKINQKYIPHDQKDTIQINSNGNYGCGDTFVKCRIFPSFNIKNFKEIDSSQGSTVYFNTKDGQCVLVR